LHGHNAFYFQWNSTDQAPITSPFMQFTCTHDSRVDDKNFSHPIEVAAIKTRTQVLLICAAVCLIVLIFTIFNCVLQRELKIGEDLERNYQRSYDYADVLNMNVGPSSYDLVKTVIDPDSSVKVSKYGCILQYL